MDVARNGVPCQSKIGRIRGGASVNGGGGNPLGHRILSECQDWYPPGPFNCPAVIPDAARMTGRGPSHTRRVCFSTTIIVCKKGSGIPAAARMTGGFSED